MKALALLGLLALAGCASSSEPASTTDGQLTSSATSRPVQVCELSYWAQTFPGNSGAGAWAEVQIVQRDFDQYAGADIALGDADAPFKGRVHIGPEGEPNQSRVTLEITKDDAFVAHSESVVATQSLATPGTPALWAGFVRSTTSPSTFTYKGVEYIGIDLGCSLSPVRH